MRILLVILSIISLAFADSSSVDFNTMSEKDLNSYISNNSSSSDIKIQIQVGVAYHSLALKKEDLKTTEQAIAYLEKANNKYKSLNKKDNPIALIYLGSAYTLMGRDSTKIAAKVENSNKGLAIMDKTIRDFPENPDIRIVRMFNGLLMPEMFKRLPKVKEDLAFLEKNNKNKAYNSVLKEGYTGLSKIEPDKTLSKQYKDRANTF